MYVCSNCGAEFRSASALAGHINACYGRFVGWLRWVGWGE